MTRECVSSAVSDAERRHIVPISGGKDSAALAVYMRQRYPDLPLEFVFSDTGCELPETYDYLARLELVLGAGVVRLSALDTLNVARKPSRDPFDYVLREYYGGFLPSPQARWCTRKLKIEPFERFVDSDDVYTYIGIRADENRAGFVPKKNPAVSRKPNVIPVYPFQDEGLGLLDVRRVLDETGLGFPKYYEWRSRSGCYFCFYQMLGEWQGLIERHPDLFAKAKSYEKCVNGRWYTWIQGKSLADIESIEKRYPVPSMDEVEGCAVCHL